MSKELIRNILRESVLSEENDSDDSGNNDSKRNTEKRQYKADIAHVRRALNPEDSLLTKSQVMGAAGLGDPDDAGDRKYFNARVDGEETEDGTIRQFSDKDLAKVVKVITNPTAYL